MLELEREVQLLREKVELLEKLKELEAAGERVRAWSPLFVPFCMGYTTSTDSSGDK